MHLQVTLSQLTACGNQLHSGKEKQLCPALVVPVSSQKFEVACFGKEVLGAVMRRMPSTCIQCRVRFVGGMQADYLRGFTVVLAPGPHMV